MLTRALACAPALLFAAAPATAQTTLYALRATGDLLRLDPATGAATFVASTGHAVVGAGPDNFGCNSGQNTTCGTLAQSILAVGPAPAPPTQVLEISRWTGEVWRTRTISGLPAGYRVRGLVASSSPAFVAILGSDDPTAENLFARVTHDDICTVVGPTGRTDLEPLALGWTGPLYALGTSGGGTLCSINPSTGAATPIGGGGFGEATHALAVMPGGSLLAAGPDLLSVDPATGATTVIGPTGIADLRALAPLSRTGCYPNCDGGGGGFPALNAGDFTCFLQKYTHGDPWANCDESTAPPALNVSDFTCFLQKFAAGCSAP